MARILFMKRWISRPESRRQGRLGQVTKQAAGRRAGPRARSAAIRSGKAIRPHTILAAALAVSALCVLPTTAPAASVEKESDWALCRDAAHRVEKATDLPHALLQAMSLVETGRRGPDGAHTAWPWTINANGRGYRFANKQEAIWAVERLRAKGMRSIDVGCMQVNLRYHPRAFTSLDEAFDPAANMAYAADFLGRLKDRHGSWRAASARYHSYNPKLREKYAARVDKTLISERQAIAARMPVPAMKPSPALPVMEAGDPTIVTASLAPSEQVTQVDAATLGLRPTLIPGLRRGIDVADPQREHQEARLALPTGAVTTR